MSAASQQIRVALEGQKDGLLRGEIFAKCTAPKGALKGALAGMRSSGEVEPIAGDSPHKTRWKLSGKTAPAGTTKPNGKKKRKASKPAKRKAATAFKRTPAAPPNGARYLPAITADSRLVLIDPEGPAKIFGVKDTEEIAELVLVHFEAD